MDGGEIIKLIIEIIKKGDIGKVRYLTLFCL